MQKRGGRLNVMGSWVWSDDEEEKKLDLVASPMSSEAVTTVEMVGVEA